MEFAKQGSEALEASNSLAAVVYFTKALIEHPTSPDYFTLRSTAFSRLKPARHDLALRDAEYAVLLGQKRQKREKIQAAQQRRVVSLYGLGRYDEAKQILQSMLRWRPKDSKKDKMEYDMWMAQITSKLKGKDIEGQETDGIKEFPEVDLPQESSMKVWLQDQLTNDGVFKFEDGEDVITPTNLPIAATTTKAEVSTADVKEEAEITAAKAEIAARSTPAQEAAPKIPSIRHDWYQDNNSVTITFYAKKVEKAKLQSEFTDDYVEISFLHPNTSSETFAFTLNPTFASIDSSTSSVKAFGTKVELKLAKKEKGIKWPALHDKDRPQVDKLPSPWTTKGDQDWDKKAANLTKKGAKKKDKKKDGNAESDSDADSEFGGDAVDGFFKKLYAGADDDTRKAMMKSFQESNGTALSTNWSEVSKGKVDEVKSKDG